MYNRIKEYREKFNLTQKELAELTNVSRQTINSLENGRYNPSVMLAYQIAKVFDKIIEDIFIFEGDEK